MKKLFAILLATAMLLSVCAFSVFAEHDFSTNQSGQFSENYASNEVIVEGWADPEFNSGRNIFYGVTITNLQRSQVVYDGYIQCVATFSDETIDMDEYVGFVTLIHEEKGDVDQCNFLPYGKTLVSFDAEFQVASSGYLKWEGIVSHTYTPGIDL
jgi:Spy/CpxP family protein refolding chaperone